MENLKKETARLIREHMLAVETLTEEQLVSAFAEAIKSGDFVRYVQKVPIANDPQQVVYLPYYQREILQKKIDNYDNALKIVADFLEVIGTKGCKRCVEILNMAKEGKDVSNESVYSYL